MATSNHERVGRGLEVLRKGLGPYVLRELKLRYDNRWAYAVSSQLSGAHYERLRNSAKSEESFLSTADSAALLKLMWGEYNDVFKNRLGFTARNYISELMNVRNAWAHQESFTLDDASRALNTITLLLKAISAAEEAEEANALYRAVLRQLFEADKQRETRRVQQESPAIAGGLLAWRDVLEPHRDVASGRYQEAEFAADLAEVLRGTAEIEYQDAKEFFRRTYLTDGMVTLLSNAMRRIAGEGGDPVVQLQTVFGGGKTHSMLALYHLLGGEIGLENVPEGEKIADAAELRYLPHATRAVLVGTDLDPTKETPHDDVTTRTLWGELAWQIGGTAGYGLVRDADERGVAPGAGTLKQLLDDHGPAVILVDELVAYARNIYGQQGLPGGTFESNLTFVQNLTEATKRSKDSLLVVSVPVSERGGEEERSDIEIGGEIGRTVTRSLEQIIGRVESVWKPVGAREGFEIVRRRLFSSKMNTAARDAVVSAFAKLYRDNSSEFPSECAEREYERRLVSAYPIHPELFDRLYQDWSTLEKFQRTRGVLRLMAAVIHELWSSNDRSLLIMPGSVPLDASRVRNQFLNYLPEGWDAVVDTDVDGTDSRPEQLDESDSRLGRYWASRRSARAVFVGSAPSVAGERARGVEEVRVRLACAQPQEPQALFTDALRRLSDQLTYLYSDGTRYWYDTRPNVNRLAADRAQQQRSSDVHGLIVERLKQDARDRGDFTAVHVSPSTGADVNDEASARLVVLSPEATHRRLSHDSSAAVSEAQRLLDSRGSSARSYRNMLVFIAADSERVGALENAARQHLAWRSILDDEEQLNLDNFSRRQARDAGRRADETVDSRVSEAYRWVIYPTQEGTEAIRWEATSAAAGNASLAVRASRKLRDDGALVMRWSPAILKKELDKYLWRESEHVKLRDLWEYLAKYPYLSRLRDVNVLVDTISEGATVRDFFGYAASVSDGRYLGLTFGDAANVHVDPESVVVKPETCVRELERREAEESARRERERRERGERDKQDERDKRDEDDTKDIDEDNEDDGRQPVLTGFHAAVKLSPSTLGEKGVLINQEVVRHLAEIYGTEVEITLEISARIPDGAPDRVVRAINENCRELGFDYYGFEESG